MSTTLQATPANGLDIDFNDMGSTFQMPPLGLMTDLIDSLAPQGDPTPAPKVAKLDNVPSFQPSDAPTMRM